MEYYTITDDENNPIRLKYNNQEIARCNTKLRELLLYDIKTTALVDIEEINEEVANGNFKLNDVKLPLKICVVDININVIPVDQPNNRIKFI